jgi:hypothetical protein
MEAVEYSLPIRILLLASRRDAEDVEGRTVPLAERKLEVLERRGRTGPGEKPKVGEGSRAGGRIIGPEEVI